MAYFDCIVGGSSDGSTLTVTCYSGFAGLTISITNGVDTFSEVCPSTSPYEVVFEGLANGTWTLSAVSSGVTYTKTVTIDNSTVFYPVPNGATVTPTDDIQTWLHCSDIWDKAYTTISEVLADTSTLLALINSNNAADYMARSTTWASNVCSDATAMGYIGSNDYCANKLLDNSTWCGEICNSVYFESVLTIKVPTMTSNTTPSGTASASSVYSTGYEAYNAFNGALSPFWSSAVNSGVNTWLRYEFPSPVKIYLATANIYDNNTTSYKIQSYSNSVWSDRKTVTSINQNTDQKIIFDSAVSAKKYQFLYTGSGSSNRSFNMQRANFYGR